MIEIATRLFRFAGVGHLNKDTGAVPKLQASLIDLASKKVGKTISIAGYTFRDAAATAAWVAPSNDPEIYGGDDSFRITLRRAEGSVLGFLETVAAYVIKEG